MTMSKIICWIKKLRHRESPGLKGNVVSEENTLLGLQGPCSFLHIPESKSPTLYVRNQSKGKTKILINIIVSETLEVECTAFS